MIQKSTFIFLIFAFATPKLFAQANPYISVLPSNSGVVTVGGTNDFLITVGNTGTGSIPVSKLRPIITVPSSVIFLADVLQTGLPAGWTILSNTGTQLRLCNSGDVIPGTTARDIILKVQGVTIFPPTTFSGQINFGNGTTCAAGPAVAGNNTADDFATSTIEVVSDPLPLALLSFNATILNCQPSLNWITETEINSDHFEIERSTIASSNWSSIGAVNAAGNTAAKSKYIYTDKNLTATSTVVLYRLKIIDKDGHYKYSEVLRVAVDCKTTQVSVYPNPVQKGNRLYISLTGAGRTTQASLLSLSGQVVLEASITNGTSYLNIANIAAGQYILNIKDDNSLNKKIKVLIQH